MPQPKVPPALRAELAERGLVIWIIHHPMRYDAPSGKSKADTSRVEVQLAGPGIDASPWGYGANTEEAVANALLSPALRMQMPGIVGAVARLEDEINKLYVAIWLETCKLGGDDDVPF